MHFHAYLVRAGAWDFGMHGDGGGGSFAGVAVAGSGSGAEAGAGGEMKYRE